MARSAVLIGLIGGALAPSIFGATLQSTEKLPYRKDQVLLLEGVKEIRIIPGTVPGPVCAVGDNAFPVLLGKISGGLQPVVTAARWNRGRVVAFGHDGAFFGEQVLAHPDTERFLLNCIRWAGENTSPLNVAVHRMPSLARWLQSGEEARRGQIRVIEWNQISPASLHHTNVLIVNTHRLSREDITTLTDFIRNGGGVLASGLGWGWLQLNPGRSLKTDHPGNLLLGEAGLVWSDGYVEGTTREGFSNSTLPGREYHALEAARLLASDQKQWKAIPEPVIRQAVQTVTLAMTVLPREHPVAQLVLNTSGRRSSILPTPQSPIRKSDTIARALLQLQVRSLLESDALVPAHLAASAFPGSVPSGAHPVRKEITVNPSIPGWQSTGLYAIPGRAITVELSSAEAVGQVFIQIGCHTDRLWHLDEWTRVPEVVKRVTLQNLRSTLSSPFGGLIYVGVVRPQSQLLRITCSIDGAVESPTYIHGETTIQDWQRIRRLPAPWGELVSQRIVLTLPSQYIRTLDNPGGVMDFWIAVIEACDRLAGGPARPDAQRIVCDQQISAGYMHSGYPIMTHLDVAPVFVNVRRMQMNDHAGVWGIFHEIGHNYQSPDWTFQGTGEVTNNLFTVYIFDHLCQVPRERTHPNLALQERVKQRQAYFAKGSHFEEWQRDPFLALDMYLQIQEAFGWEPFEKTFAAYRQLKPEERPRTDAEKRDQWLVRLSRAVGRDLSPFFRQWGIPISPGAAQSLSDLPPWQAGM